MATSNNERRRYPRLEAAYEVFLTHRGRLSISRARDISTHGISILTNEQLSQNDSVELKVVVPQAGMNLEATGKVKYTQPANGSGKGTDFTRLAGIEYDERRGDDYALAGKLGQKDVHSVAHTVSIDAPPLVCYRAIADFERYPEWAGTVEGMPVVDRYPDGRARNVNMVHNVFFTRFTYPLIYSYEDERLVFHWHNTGGDVGIVGSYTFLPVGVNTVATFKLDVTLPFPLSKRIAQYMTGVVMRKELKGFKKFVETNQAAWQK